MLHGARGRGAMVPNKIERHRKFVYGIANITHAAFSCRHIHARPTPHQNDHSRLKKINVEEVENATPTCR